MKNVTLNTVGTLIQFNLTKQARNVRLNIFIRVLISRIMTLLIPHPLHVNDVKRLDRC